MTLGAPSAGWRLWLASLFCAAIIAGPMARLALRQLPAPIFQEPDLARLLSSAPINWAPRTPGGAVIDPRWSPETQAAYDRVDFRRFGTPDGRDLTVLITWSGNGHARGGHPQQVCYSAQGFSVADLERTTIRVGERSIPATKFAARGQGVDEHVLYWRVSGGRVFVGHDHSIWDRRLLQAQLFLRQQLAAHPDDDLMVRLSIRSSGAAGSSPLGHRELESLAAEFVQAQEPRLRLKVAGGED